MFDNRRKCNFVKGKKQNTLVFEVIVLAIITLILNLVSIDRPILFFISTFFSVIPVVVITVKYKEIWAAIASLGVFIALLLIFGIPIALIKFMVYSAVGISIGYSLRNKFNLKQSVIVGGVGCITAFISIHVLFSEIWGINIIQNLLINNTLDLLEKNKNNLSSLVRLPDMTPEAIYFEVRNILNILFLFIPGAITISCIIYSYAAILLSIAIIKRMNSIKSNIEPFSEFKLPISLGIVFLIIQLILWNTDIRQDNVDNWTMLFLNLELVLGFAFMVQGMALIDFWFKKLGLDGNLRIIVYAVGSLVLWPFVLFLNLPFVFLLIGILDYLIDFRKLETK